MAKTILIKRGTVANLPDLQEGEPGWAKDTKQLYVGDGEGAPVKVSSSLSDLGLDADLATFALPADTTISAFGATLVDDANAAAVLATLSLDADLATFALPANTTISAFGATLVDDATKIAAKATLGIPVTYVDDYASIAEAVTAATTGGILQFGPSTKTITAEVTINKALTIQGCGITSQITQSTGGKCHFLVTASNVTIRDLYFYGPQYAASAAEIGVKAYGANAGAMISKIKVENCYFKNLGYGGVYLEFVKHFIVNNNVIENVHYTGIAAICCTDGDVSGNIIDNIPSSVGLGWNAYGVILTRNPVDSLATSPRAARITCCRNNIKNIPTWDALNTHAGSELLFADNLIYNCYRGVNATDCPGTDTTTMYACYNVKIIGNHMESGAGDGSHDIGICLNGSLDDVDTVLDYAEQCSIIGNTVIGYGAEDTSQSGGIFASATKGVVVNDNNVRSCSPNGIVFYGCNQNAVCAGNSVMDIWCSTTAVGTAIAVNVITENNTFIISDLMASELSSGGGTYKLNSSGTGFGVKVENADGNGGKLGLVYGNVDALLSDAGSKIAKNLNTVT